MDTFTEALHQRIRTARTKLHDARENRDLDAELVYAGELDSLLRLALENGITVPPDVPGDHT